MESPFKYYIFWFKDETVTYTKIDSGGFLNIIKIYIMHVSIVFVCDCFHHFLNIWPSSIVFSSVINIITLDIDNIITWISIHDLRSFLNLLQTVIFHITPETNISYLNLSSIHINNEIHLKKCRRIRANLQMRID